MQGRKKAPQAMKITEGQGYEHEAKKLIQGPVKRTDIPPTGYNAERVI